MNYSKSSTKTFRNLFFVAVIILLILPFWITSQEFFTRIVMSMGWYRSIQAVIVPYELHLISLLLSLFGCSLQIGSTFIQWQTSQGGNEVIYLAWNCVGWQTFILLFITLFSGLSGNHTFLSKMITLGIGIMGTYLINCLRLMLIILVYIWTGRTFGTIFHDYFSNIFTLIWLSFYWWFSYKFVLEEKQKNN
ncbi:hypothetical protein KSZ_32300 [Dictyobacter formicarum]|uniref:Exosortase/archaeosortase family protein n=2 Tax=Dictyobacter formicarum TaxID=2778368 RepID=A0ABQ3VHQ0_9CHLR|nr:hypothetical protein KSZ_32300 [Dictyobacter formicarum]